MFQPYRQLPSGCSATEQGLRLWDVDADGQVATLFESLGSQARCWRLGPNWQSEFDLEVPERDYVAICWLSSGLLGLHWHAPTEPSNLDLYRPSPKSESAFQLKASFHVGNNLSALQGDHDNRLWVAYSYRGFSQSLAHYGPACFQADGQLVQPFWYCPALDGTCLNVLQRSTWFCGYPSFRLCQIGPNRKMQTWSLDEIRPRVLACRGWLIAAGFWPRYSEPDVEVVVLDVSGGQPRFVQRQTARPPGPVLARGPYLHSFTPDCWFRWEPFAS